MERNMKRKLLVMSLSLVIASSLVLGGCGKTNESVATSTEVEEAVEGTEKATEKKEVVKSTETEKAEEIKVETKTETEKAVESTESEVSVKETSGSEVKESTSGKSKETTTSTSGSTSVSNTSGSSITGGTSSSNTETPHVHNWVAVTSTVNHPAETHQEDQGHYETVVDSEAWDEEVPKYTERGCYCLTCYYKNGSIVKLANQTEVDNHALYHFNTFNESCQYGIQSLQNGTETIHHDAVTHQEWIPNMVTVVDKEAWDEEVTTGYVCSECGATK